MGVLEPSMSPWVANNVILRKVDGGIRVTLNVCRLNDLTITEYYPMENVQDTLEWLGTKKGFSVF